MFDSSWFGLIPIVLLLMLSGFYLLPFFQVLVARGRKERKKWQYMALVGRSMSKRAKDRLVAEEFYSGLLTLRSKNIITDKDKKAYLRILEICLELEPGTLRPARPTPWELKNRLRQMGFVRRRQKGQAKIITADNKRNLAATLLTGGR